MPVKIKQGEEVFETNKFYEKDRDVITLPFFTSTVQAGFPDPEGDTQEESIKINRRYVKNPKTSFCIRAAGDSMIRAGIDPGTLLVVDRSIKPNNGEIVLAVINNEMTIKRFFQKDNRVFLLPENPHYPNIEIKAEDNFKIAGVVVHIIPRGEELDAMMELIAAKKSA